MEIYLFFTLLAYTFNMSSKKHHLINLRGIQLMKKIICGFMAVVGMTLISGCSTAIAEGGFNLLVRL